MGEQRHATDIAQVRAHQISATSQGSSIAIGTDHRERRHALKALRNFGVS
jgi:hypothetical protein